MNRTFLVLIFILILTTMSTNIVYGEEYSEPAEVILTVDSFTLPQIQKDNWTTINLTINDIVGVNWSDYTEEGYGGEWGRYLYMKWVWPFIFPDAIEYVGYTSITIEPEILSSHPEGWDIYLEPSSFSNSTTGAIHNVVLYAKTTDIVVDYNPMVRLKILRNDRTGIPVGCSYAYFPLKAVGGAYAQLSTAHLTTYASPRSIITIPFEVVHLGEYATTYTISAMTASDAIVRTTDQYITLEPGEMRSSSATIILPEEAYDPGTMYRINVTATPQNSLSSQTMQFIVISQGVYINPLMYIVLIFSVVLLAVIYILIRFTIKRFNKPLHERIFLRKRPDGTKIPRFYKRLKKRQSTSTGDLSNKSPSKRRSGHQKKEHKSEQDYDATLKRIQRQQEK